MKAWLGLAITICLLYTGTAQSPPCASDEVDNPVGTCTCNSTLYNSSAPVDNPSLECLAGKIRLTLGRCQLEKSKYNSANVHLLDTNCVGIRTVNDIADIVVTTNARRGTCGTNLLVNGSHAIYSNNLTIPAKVFASGLIAKQNISFSFSCSYPLNMSVALVSAIKPVIGTTTILLPGGIGSVTVTMAVFTLPDFTNPYSELSTPLNVEDPMYISVLIPALDANVFAVKVVRLYAKGSNISSDEAEYDLITNGCPSADLGSLVTVEKNGDGNEARFVVNVFKITNSDSVFLFADVQICENTCILGCTGTRVDYKGKVGETSTVNSGPYRADFPDASSGASDRFSWTWTVNSILLSLLGLRLL